MVTGKVVSDRSEIDEMLPRCVELARESGSMLPFQYLRMPLLWWDHFNNTDGTEFSRKRGTNFLGARSWLKDMHLLVAMDGTVIVGAAPVVRYLVKIPGDEKPVRIITFPGDYQLISRHDFIVSGASRKEALWSLLDSLMQCIENEDDIVVTPYISEDSLNIEGLRCYLDDAPGMGLKCLSAETGRRGGVRPWTIDAILSCLRQVADRIALQPLMDETTQLINDLAACPPMKLLFPQTRKRFEQELQRLLESYESESGLEHIVDELEALLVDAPVIYPFIQLPGDRRSYMDTLGKSTRVNTQNLRNRFAGHGGEIERVAPSDITENDIHDYLALHNLRWGDVSSSLRGDASFKFHHELCRILSSEGCLTLFFARYQGRRIASCSCIDVQGRREIYLTGRDLEYDRWSAGRLILLESILDAIDRGFSIYDMGLGWFAYKMAFAKSYTKTWNFFFSRRKTMEDIGKLYLGFECMIAQ